MVGVAPFVCMAPMRVACAPAIPQFAAPTAKISSTLGYVQHISTAIPIDTDSSKLLHINVFCGATDDDDAG